MKRLLPLLACALLFTGCAKTVKFAVAFDTEDASRRADLEAAVGRIVEGRVTSKGKKVVKQKIDAKDGASVLTVRVSDAEATKLLADGLTTTFSMTIMQQVPAGKGDIVSEKFGEFKETGISTGHFDWVAMGLSIGETGASSGSVVLTLTNEGRELLKEIFSKNKGSVIGIFVRGQLMSKKLVNANDKQDAIQIDGIPSAELAQAFADDVNVGLHAKFTPMQ